MSHFFIISGESSGDKLGALIGGELLTQGHQVSGWGGQNMLKTGIHLNQHIDELKVMGWTDVIFSLSKYFTLLSKCKRDIKTSTPDSIILIDFGSFNLRIAKWAKKEGLKVFYYSPPKIWASRPRRIAQLKEFCEKVIVLFPFEKVYYEERGLAVEYYGHPLAEQIKSFYCNPDFRSDYELDKRPILSIIPGSRSSEIKNTLSIYLKAVSDMTDYQVCVSCVEGQEALVQNICESVPTATTIITNHFYDLLSNSDLALVTSGTATLEVALFGIPQIVGYKTSWLNYTIAKSIITVDYISLVNLIVQEQAVVELIQSSLNPENIKFALNQLLNPKAQKKLLDYYDEITSRIYQTDCILKKVQSICN